MGRGKLNMELISEERSRILTFKKRKEGLMRKLHELTTLCDLNACMIIYGPIQENRATEPEIWPPNPDEVGRMIAVYKSKGNDSGSHKSFGLSDFFRERERKAEEELAKLRKRNVEAKYPTPSEWLSFLSEAELRVFAAALNNKVQFVRSRVEFLKREKQELDMMNAMMSLGQSHSFYALNYDQEIKPVFDMGSASVSFDRQVFYDQATAAGDGLSNSMICYNTTRPLGQIDYAPSMLQPAPPPYMHWSTVAPPTQWPLATNENLNYRDNGGEDDIIQYLLQFN